MLQAALMLALCVGVPCGASLLNFARVHGHSAAPSSSLENDDTPLPGRVLVYDLQSRCRECL